jgi:hypothetical protein
MPRSVSARSEAEQLEPVTPGEPTRVGDAAEWFSFAITSFKMQHQKELNTLDLVIRYRYVIGLGSYPDFRSMVVDIERLLREYPNHSDYWEKVNKAIARILFERYPMIAWVKCTMLVAPTRMDPYRRSSVVEMARG